MRWAIAFALVGCSAGIPCDESFDDFCGSTQTAQKVECQPTLAESRRVYCEYYADKPAEIRHCGDYDRFSMPNLAGAPELYFEHDSSAPVAYGTVAADGTHACQLGPSSIDLPSDADCVEPEVACPIAGS